MYITFQKKTLLFLIVAQVMYEGTEISFTRDKSDVPLGGTALYRQGTCDVQHNSTDV